MEGTVRRRYEVGASGLMRRIPEKLLIPIFRHYGPLPRRGFVNVAKGLIDVGTSRDASLRCRLCLTRQSQLKLLFR